MLVVCLFTCLSGSLFVCLFVSIVVIIIIIIIVLLTIQIPSTLIPFSPDILQFLEFSLRPMVLSSVLTPTVLQILLGPGQTTEI